MAQRFAYLVAILDLYSRKVLSIRVSNALTTEFCVEAVEEALTRCGTPEIFNTDQGSQFTAADFTAVLLTRGCASAWMLPMATTAFQGIFGLKRENYAAPYDAREMAGRMDSCYAYSRERSVVKMHWPELYRPPRSAPSE